MILGTPGAGKGLDDIGMRDVLHTLGSHDDGDDDGDDDDDDNEDDEDDDKYNNSDDSSKSIIFLSYSSL